MGVCSGCGYEVYKRIDNVFTCVDWDLDEMSFLGVCICIQYEVGHVNDMSTYLIRSAYGTIEVNDMSAYLIRSAYASIEVNDMSTYLIRSAYGAIESYLLILAPTT